MIKRTLFFGNPAYLRFKDEQLVINLPETSALPEKDRTITIPIEDIGFVVLENPQITITHQLMSALVENNVAVLTCDHRHMPTGLLLPLEGNTTQCERFTHQINASEPLRKQLWQQTVRQKILNQAAVLNQEGRKTENMKYWADQVKSGDTENHEGRAAAYYWGELFDTSLDFRRDPDGFAPNNLLNYGYAILRATVARSLVASGMLPTLGIHHHNRYNAYCLADDVMEPYRPYVDRLVLEILDGPEMPEELTKEHKAKLLQIPVLDVTINDRRSPLMLAAQQTTASLAKCFLGELRKIEYPEMN
ncbi:MAG: type II CRISPR-associated endonuclease Cas1 [Mariniphaga sp.]|nr:type II CRISPR-associated endonuclease Cas1 [Mariniphaga sp.]